MIFVWWWTNAQFSICRTSNRASAKASAKIHGKLGIFEEIMPGSLKAQKMLKSHHHLLHADGSIAQNVWADLMKMSIDFNHFRLQPNGSTQKSKVYRWGFFWRCNNFFHFLFSMAELIAHLIITALCGLIWFIIVASAAKNRFLVFTNNFFEAEKNIKNVRDRKFLHFDFRTKY